MHGTTLWYLTRGSGIVALILVTASVVLGVSSAARLQARRWPRFAIGAVHRNLTLLTVAFVAIHVVTTVADGYAPVGYLDAFVPFHSPYRPLWLGLGAVAFDLVLALVVTSYLRRRIGARAWRGVHWLAYGAWPIALLHAFGTGSDGHSTWLVALGALSLAAVGGAILLRVATASASRTRTVAAAATLAVAAVLCGWYATGPAQSGWAARAGTPGRLLASRRAAGGTAPQLTVAPTAPGSFAVAARGTIDQSRSGNGTTRVVIRLRLDGPPRGSLRIDLQGDAVGGGVSLRASGVSFVPATTRAVYFGSVVGLDGNLVVAQVSDHAGDTLRISADLTTARSGTAAATVSAVSIEGSEDG
jgi:Ferric reductase like transmembrane component